ncbi:MAG: ABC transporter permease [Desulfobacterota bacterium]|nr:ABC transporter permease [Thermodesulfobacteriota bacterium]
MGVPLAYSIRNLWTRKLTTLFTVSGMALVVFVFSSMLMLSEGLKKTLIETGSSDNVVVIRKGAATEVQSGVDRYQASIIETQPEVAVGEDGKPLLSKETVVIISLPRRGSKKENYITVRGIGEASLGLRPQVKLLEGRLPRPGTSELLTGRSVAERFEGGGLGESLRFGLREWKVVGVFDAGPTGFNSEIWVDGDQLMQTFRRNAYSSVLFKLRDPSSFERVKGRIENDPRLTLEAKRENQYYGEQSRMMATFLRILGTSLTIIFSLGAIIGAMITMYAAVANRTAEIGTLRALGFKRVSILTAFLLEALFLGLSGGLLGLFFASFLQFFTVSTMNFQTFSELAFDFTLTWEIAYQALVFSLIMGFVGGLLPALRAARMNIVESLRAT